MMTVEYRATITAEQRAARKRERDEARAIRRYQRFADRLFNGMAVAYCVFMVMATILTIMSAGR